MIVAIFIFSAILLINIVLLLLFRFNFKTYNKDLEAFSWPTISILLAARNEEEYLRACVETIFMLDYPKEKIQILIGNDDSEDHTQDVIDALISEDERVVSVPIAQGYQRIGSVSE
jgi:cellulose synthase/poly-beta-1,6-N-acetylglucosamine synthase-like glycosyltransferase